MDAPPPGVHRRPCRAVLPGLLVQRNQPYQGKIDAIAAPLLGYGILAGVIELAANNIAGGLLHILKALVTQMFLLSVGASLGIATENAVCELAPPPSGPEFLSDLFQILWIPMLCIGLGVALQNSCWDSLWSVLCQAFVYAAVRRSRPGPQQTKH